MNKKEAEGNWKLPLSLPLFQLRFVRAHTYTSTPLHENDADSIPLTQDKTVERSKVEEK